jgi:cyclic pyranopterin monophosphate synthase
VSDHPESEARMVDVGSKDVTRREATASGLVRMGERTRDLVTSGRLEKGDALEVARIAGIMAAKKTAELIPLCHPLAIDAVEVTLHAVDEGIRIESTVRAAQKTGVEMEALTGVAVAALTVYDMVKSIERGVAVTDIRLETKSGGRSGDYRRELD